jgi:hypothetical protein
MGSMAEERRELDGPTLDLLFELTRHAPEVQLRNVDSIDTKIVQVFSVSSVLIGLASLRGVHHQTVAGILLGIAVVAFLFVAYYVLRTLWATRFRILISPTQLWRDYWADSPDSIKHAVVADIADGYAQNEDVLQQKYRALGRALIGAGVEAAAIGIALVASTV